MTHRNVIKTGVKALMRANGSNSGFRKSNFLLKIFKVSDNNSHYKFSQYSHYTLSV